MKAWNKAQDPQEIARKIFRRGFFTRLSIPPEFKQSEHEIRLLRTVLDRTFVDIVSTDATVAEKIDAIKWLDESNVSCAAEFKYICSNACLSASKVRKSFEFLLENYFNTNLKNIIDELPSHTYNTSCIEGK